MATLYGEGGGGGGGEEGEGEANHEQGHKYMGMGGFGGRRGGGRRLIMDGATSHGDGGRCDVGG